MSKGREIYFVTWLRAMAVVLILLCHLASWSGTPLFLIASQILNVGVPIFFMISGFLFGIKGGQNKYLIRWYVKRIKRIYVPYELFLVILFVLHLITREKINAIQWLKTALGIHGFDGVEGAEQTWFISAILICYLVTPIIASFVEFIVKKSKEIQIGLVIVILILPCVIPFIVKMDLVPFISPIIWYYFAYYCGWNWNKIEQNIDKTKCRNAIMIIGVMFALRVIGRILLDDTIWYESVVVTYEHNIVSFCIAIVFIYFFSNKTPISIVKTISDISFEIYLYHYIFGVGPVKLIGLTNWYILDCVLIIILSVGTAYVMNKVSKIILEKCKGYV